MTLKETKLSTETYVREHYKLFHKWNHNKTVCVVINQYNNKCVSTTQTSHTTVGS